MKMPFRPAYLKLYESGELQRRAQAAILMLESCQVCPRDCKVIELKTRRLSVKPAGWRR